MAVLLLVFAACVVATVYSHPMPLDQAQMKTQALPKLSLQKDFTSKHPKTSQLAEKRFYSLQSCIDMIAVE